MSKKLSRLLEPGMWLYFVVLLALSGTAFALQQYFLGSLALAAVIALLVYNRLDDKRRKKALMDYIHSATDSFGTAARQGSPFPLAVIKMTDGEIVWGNPQFYEATGTRESAMRRTISDVFPNFSTRWITEGRMECPRDVRIGEKRYRIYGNLIRSDEEQATVLLATLYMADMTEMFNVRDEFVRTRPIVATLLVDNYDELTNKMADSAVSSLDARLNDCIGAWCTDLNGMVQKYARNRWILVFENRDLGRLQENKFAILDEIRTITAPSGLAATLSIGIGKDGSNFRENLDFSSLSIEMALSRGGDQVVIKDKFNFSFFGGRTKEAERPTSVKARVIANSLTALIRQSETVFIMGHAMADLDAVGAAMGVVTMCRKQGKPVHLVLDREKNSAGTVLELIAADETFAELIMPAEEAVLAADPDSLLVVVDTNRPDQVESRALLESVNRVAIIDHHRRAADYIQNPILNHHEPFASSASEMTTELLMYAVESRDIHPIEAMALLAGIVLDTKNFTVRTGSRTFEAAAFLRRAGADTVDVKKLFQNDLDTTVNRYRIVQAARLYRGNIAIAALDYPANRVLAAQAADELLNIRGIMASFVLYPDDGRVIMSARSIGDANVQVILEALGGGGNAATAGAQISGKSVRQVLAELVASIDKFYEK